MIKGLRQLICLDLDGPILDVSDRYYRVYSDILKQHATEPLRKHSYWNLKRNKIGELEILKESCAADKGFVRDYLETRARLIESSEYLLFDRAWPGIHDTLQVLSRGAELALVTLRRSAELLKLQLSTLELLEAFDHILSKSTGSEGIDRAKLKLGLVREQYRDYELDGWFIGDTETDIRAGRLLGLRTVAITFGIRTIEHLEAVSPDVVLHSPKEFHRWAEDVADSFRPASGV